MFYIRRSSEPCSANVPSTEGEEKVVSADIGRGTGDSVGEACVSMDKFSTTSSMYIYPDYDGGAPEPFGALAHANLPDGECVEEDYKNTEKPTGIIDHNKTCSPHT